MNTNMADGMWAAGLLAYGEACICVKLTVLFCVQRGLVYLNCTVCDRVMFWNDIISMNESEVTCWARTAGSAICRTSQSVKENWCLRLKRGLWVPGLFSALIRLLWLCQWDSD
jgi:hypothetical protein